jgi:hypothetical protein
MFLKISERTISYIRMIRHKLRKDQNIEGKIQIKMTIEKIQHIPVQ